MNKSQQGKEFGKAIIQILPKGIMQEVMHKSNRKKIAKKWN